MNTTSAPITAIRKGDTLVTGFGTLEIVSHVVAEVEVSYTYGALYTVRCEDGYRISDTPGGFWYQIVKADPEAHAAAEKAASAFASAWDNRR